jgi:hypothetical protein
MHLVSVPERRCLSSGFLCLAIVALTSLIASRGECQNGSQWIAFDQSPPGTPASVVFDAAASDPSTSIVDVTLSGLWVSTRVGPDNATYQDLVIPGLPNLSQLGAPRLPLVRFLVGVLSGASSATLAGSLAQQTVTLSGIHVWPEPVEIQLHDGSPEQFVRDDAIYSSNVLWPPEQTNTLFALENLPGEIPCAEISLNPVQWNPATDELRVQVRSRWFITHSGTPPSEGNLIPKTLASLASTSLINWPVISPYLPVDVVHYSGYFLFVRPSRFRLDLEPLIAQKLARGFKVAEVSTDTTGADSLRIFAAIRAWYRGTPRKADHFCLLVADADSIPNSPSPPLFGNPQGVYSDDPYGSMDGLNLDKEVFVGRLPADTPLDVRDMVKRILRYEDNPPVGSHFDKTVLMAHRDVLDGTTIPISSLQENVRTATYTTTPTFVTAYGESPASTNAFLIGELDAGMGLLCYIGHSSSGGYTYWNVVPQDFSSGTLTTLTNAPKAPLVWSFSCSAGFVKGNDCFGETWVNVGPNGAVGFYGATALVGAPSCATLDRSLFDEVYNLGHVVQGYTYAAGERRMELEHHNGESWKFLLLGDPQMAIRRRDPVIVYTLAPEIRDYACPTGTCHELRVAVRDGSNAPIPGALVGAWKPGPALGTRAASTQGEISDNRYADQDGLARIPFPAPLTDGTLYYTVQLDDGTALLDSVRVEGGNVSGVPDTKASETSFFRAVPVVTRGPVLFSFEPPASPDARLELFTVAGRLVRTLPVPSGESSVAWTGTDRAGSDVPSGVYWARLHDNQSVRTCRIVLAR